MANDQQIRAAIAEAGRVLAGATSTAPDHRTLFPELRRRGRQDAAVPAIAGNGCTAEQASHPRPVTPAAEADVTPEAVAGWSAELGFAASAKQGRVTKASD